MNFLRTIWETRLVKAFENVSVLDMITTAPSEMTGSSVVFNRVGAGDIKDYDGEIEWGDIDTVPVTMTFDFKKYFADKVDDVDKAQTNLAVVDEFAVAQVNKIGAAADAYAYAKYAAGAGTKLDAVTVDAPEAIYDAIVDLGVALGKKNVPVANRYVVIDWDALGLLQKDKRFTHNPEVLANGIVNGQKINGMTIVISANAPANTLIALYKGAVGFGKQIDELEAMRLQSDFADGVRGLTVGGAAVLNANGVATVTYTFKTATETEDETVTEPETPETEDETVEPNE